MGRGGGGSRAGASKGGGSAGGGSAGSPASSAEQQFGVTFVPPQGHGLKTVMVDVAKFDASLAKDKSFYVEPGGVGRSAIAGRYRDFGEFIGKARSQKIPIEQTVVHVDAKGRASIGDGRHRWAWFRDHGAKTLPVSVDRTIADRVKKLYGAH